jgi:hypothetical protein
VPPIIRSAFVLVTCLGVLGGAGWLATVALGASSVAPTQLTRAPLVVDTYDTGGVTRLTVLEPMTFPSAGGPREVPAGTQFVTASALLDSSLAAPATAAVGDTLSCALRVNVSQGEPIIDLVRCAPGRGSPRG